MLVEITKALPVDVYRNNSGDCTNKGVSSTINDFYIIPENGGLFWSGHIHGEHDSSKILVIVEFKTGGSTSLRAVPYDLWITKKWVQFGGNFIYTSDSRFPSNQPIKIFDRVE